jgi:hypothetical protein
MNTNNTQQLNSILDKHNEVKELLQEEYRAWRIDWKTLTHIKTSLSNILQNIPKKKFEYLRKELYDLFAIVTM